MCKAQIVEVQKSFKMIPIANEIPGNYSFTVHFQLLRRRFRRIWLVFDDFQYGSHFGGVKLKKCYSQFHGEW